MPTSTHLSDGRQLDLLPEAEACKLSAMARPCPGGKSRAASYRPCRAAVPSLHRRDRVTVDLRGLRARLETKAVQHQTTAAALVRRAVVLMLDDGGASGDKLDGIQPASDGKVTKLTLRVSPMHAATLARRARAADMAQGQYLCALLDGVPAPSLPADHSAAVAALRASTDRVAAMSVDLNAFLRLLGRVPASQLEDYRAGLRSLSDDMRAHLATASALIADLAPSKRAKR